MTYTKFPSIRVKGAEHTCVVGWESIGEAIHQRIDPEKPKNLIVIECYQGIYPEDIIGNISEKVPHTKVFSTPDYFKEEKEIRALTQTDVTDNRIFGYMSRLNMIDFIDPLKLRNTGKMIEEIDEGTVLVIGHGASLVEEKPDVFVYADMARWEIQMRMRRHMVNNLGISNAEEPFETQYKRGYFVDWRVCDRLKKMTMTKWDFVLDTNNPDVPKMARASSVFKGLRQAAQRPFSVVPFFDPGPWGGQWMKKVCGLDTSVENYAWCFNCVPEENSLLLDFEGITMELPSINLVFYQPVALLGDAVHARFGDEFPIRFDFLDTMDGGNLSLQVHPLTEYIREKFGLHYTQDESYYIMDAGKDAEVYLGLKEDVDPNEMINDLERAQDGGRSFEAEKYVETWPAKKHDHFLIPAGTVHCSGKDSMVLEISATPYIFTFKLWDWGRVGLDGKPRPINIEHGKNVIQWDRSTSWVREHLINKVERVAEGDGWKEESTGLHAREFIETRRYWLTKGIGLNTRGGVNVLCLVEGEEVVVESPDQAFDSFAVNYAEVFIVPASVGEYTVKPGGQSDGKQVAIIRAYVRTQA
ncbi:MAG: class I mannose-6-phosphate isomerase [Cytophagales bacterium]|nr:class I mannose-6-phosphate isomerase [Cytophagales bacterium]